MEIIDLTHPLHNEMIKFIAPWHIETNIKRLGTIEQVGRNTSTIYVGSHAGTHMDAAKHFIEDGESIEQVLLDKLIGPVTILDFSTKEKYTSLSIKDLSGIEVADRMLFYFGWDKYWNTRQFYEGYPWFSSQVAQYLVDNGAKVIGMDTPSPDDSTIVLHSDNDSVIHKLFLSQGVTLIEYLANLGDANLNKKWILCALPLPIKDCDGSPIRACLICDN